MIEETRRSQLEHILLLIETRRKIAFRGFPNAKKDMGILIQDPLLVDALATQEELLELWVFLEREIIEKDMHRP
jgi:ABC-type uncharacterized transport system YnjBCD ATPase subunit